MKEAKNQDERIN